ncbi:MAG: competence/damage-inducible protein A [Clostridia bacterium]|nr:competence/damage-inducible protein A [Clostridia bacterium]
MNAEIVAVGTEILLGQILNSNAKYISEKLAELGIDVFYHTSVGDNRHRLTEAVRIAHDRSDLVILTGGLGPTGDDLTKETLAEFLQKPLEVRSEEVEILKAALAKRNIAFRDGHYKQVAFIPESSVLKNDYGTSPGMAVQLDKKVYIVLPGPPREMEPMFLNYTVPWLTAHLLGSGHQKIFSKVLKLVEMTESAVEESIKDLIDTQTTPTIATLLGPGVVIVRLTARACDETEFQEIIKPVRDEIEKRIGRYIAAEDKETVWDNAATLLTKRSLTVSTAESCTAGLLSASFTKLPGSSEYFTGAIIAYSNEIKEKLLGVPAAILEKHGAVSEETARAMAAGVRKVTGSSVGIGVTGIAGPDGGTKEKPVGMVCIALDAQDQQTAKTFYFNGKRETIREMSVNRAQILLYNYLKEG